MRALIVRKTRTSLSESALVTFERDVLGLDHPMVVDGPRRPYRGSYRYENGSQVNTGGMDKPGRVLSSEYDIIYCQQAEELAEEDWETLTTRLRSDKMPFRQMIACCNPDRPTHWLKARCDEGKAALLDSRHEDNPILWDGRAWTPLGVDYISKLDALSGARKQRLRYGRWVQAEGLVFNGWNAAVHLVDRFDIPAQWTRFRVIDFGYTNAFVCQWWAVDRDGRMFCYREIYHTQRTVKVHAQKIKELSAGERITATVCDHDAEDMATLRENGIATRAAKKAVSVGIQKVQERLKAAGDGRPRLFFLRDSLVEVDPSLVEAKKPINTVQGFDGYVWSNSKTKEAPVKENDHGMDSVRYAVMYRDGPRGIGFA
jgi:phage terminase large subunit